MSRARREDVLATNSHNIDGSGQQTVDELLAKYAAQLEAAVDRIDELEQRVSALEERLENEGQSPADDDLCTLERYAAMPEDREDLISTSQQRAVAVFENWWDMAEETPKGYVVSTRRNSFTEPRFGGGNRRPRP